MNWGIAFRVRQYVKSSLWIAPFVGGLAGILAAGAGLWLDSQGVAAFWRYSPETATAVLSSTIGAAASLTGFVVTVTVLGVQMATGTFSPRYMRLWYRDGRLKLILAELIGTLLFAVLVIRQISAESVPDLSVSLAGLGVSVGVLLFVLYLDRFVHRMRPVAVAELMTKEARRAFDAWVRQAERPDTSLVHRGSPGPSTPASAVVRATRSGTIQAVDTDGLTRFARHHNCLLVFRHGIGDFVPTGSSIIDVYGTGVPPADAQRLSSLIALGAERTIEQDPAFGIRIMVDVATRALSPAINDPTTAVQVLDYLAETLRTIGSYPTASMLAIETLPESSAPGVVMPVRSWPDFLTLAITEIREYGATSIQVMRRLRALLEELRELVLPENRPAVDEELRRLDATLGEWATNLVDLDLARVADPQGIGGPARTPEANQRSRMA